MRDIFSARFDNARGFDPGNVHEGKNIRGLDLRYRTTYERNIRGLDLGYCTTYGRIHEVLILDIVPHMEGYARFVSSQRD